MSSASTPAGGQHVCRYLSEKEKEHEPHSCMKKKKRQMERVQRRVQAAGGPRGAPGGQARGKHPGRGNGTGGSSGRNRCLAVRFFLLFFFYHPQWLVPFSIVGCGGACPCCAAGAVPSLPSLSLALFSLVMSHSFARTHAQKPLTDTYLFFPFFSLFFPCPTLIKPPTAQQPRGKEAALPLGRVLA